MMYHRSTTSTWPCVQPVLLVLCLKAHTLRLVSPFASVTLRPPISAYTDELMATAPSHCPDELVPDSPELQRIIHWVKSDRHANAFLVLQNDKILVEEYFNGRRKEDKSDVFSVSKSVVSLLIGIAAQKELVALDNPISYYTRPNETWSQTSRERESKITVSHVLQMTCGLDDEMKYVAPPGTRWHYNLGTAWHMLKEVIEGASKLPMQTVADAWLFKKLGISPIFQPRSGGSKVFDLVKAYVQNYYQDMIRNYSLSPINIAVAFIYSAYRKTGSRLLHFVSSYMTMFLLLAIKDGYSMYRKYSGARKYFKTPTTSLHCSGMDCIRLGQLILHNGRHPTTNEQIVEKAYIDTCKSATLQRLNPSYSNMFWLNGKGKHINPTTIFSRVDPPVIHEDLVPTAPQDMISFMGYNTQRIYVVPSLNIVVVRLGDEDSDGATAAKSPFDNRLWEMLMELFHKMQAGRKQSRGRSLTIQATMANKL